MGASVSNSRLPDSRSFNLIKDSMLQSDELPLAEVLDENQWEAIFGKHQIDFGNDEQAVYTPAITLWALLSQAFFKQEMRSCKAAVGRVASLWATLGRTVCNTNTGAYCRARAKISWQARLPGDFGSGTAVGSCVGVANCSAKRCPKACHAPNGSFAAPHLLFEKRLREQCPKSDRWRVDSLLVVAEVDLVFSKNGFPLVFVENFSQREFIRLQHAVFDQVKTAAVRKP